MTEILAIVFGVIAAISAVSFLALRVKLGSLVKNLREVKAKYIEVAPDGLTDSEKMALADEVIDVIQDAADLFQMAANFALAVRRVLRRRL